MEVQQTRLIRTDRGYDYGTWYISNMKCINGVIIHITTTAVGYISNYERQSLFWPRGWGIYLKPDKNMNLLPDIWVSKILTNAYNEVQQEWSWRIQRVTDACVLSFYGYKKCIKRLIWTALLPTTFNSWLVNVSSDNLITKSTRFQVFLTDFCRLLTWQITRTMIFISSWSHMFW